MDFTWLVHGKGYGTPRHRHTFDQIRLTFEGVRQSDDGDMGPGECGYFPEGVAYGPQHQDEQEVGLILQFECENGRTRLIIAGASLPFGNREILFDDEGQEAAAGTMLGRFRRPSWLTKVK